MQTCNRTFHECTLGAALLLFALVCAAPAAAQQPQPPPALTLRLPPADTGKPLVFEAPARLAEPPPAPAAACAMLLSCRARLLGTTGRNGAVELKVTPFSW